MPKILVTAKISVNYSSDQFHTLQFPFYWRPELGFCSTS
uniref:Uncharacterized protein n=1 Tax=Anguilla anguilla TaxID=7936 RepID=A0A0E9XM27_ANGAN